MPVISHITGHQGAAATGRPQKRYYAFLTDRVIFVLVATGTTGVFGQEGLSFINEIGKRIVSRTRQSNAVTFLHQRISLATQRGNVPPILGTLLPEGKELEEVYYFFPF